MQDYRESLLLKYTDDLEKCRTYEQLGSWSDDYMHEIIVHFSLKLHDSLFKSRLRDIYMNTKEVAFVKALNDKNPERDIKKAEAFARMLEIPENDRKRIFGAIRKLYEIHD
jgi:hypothetical protein